MRTQPFTAVTDAPVILDAHERVWRLTLNRPQQGNACSAELVSALERILGRAESEQAQALVLQGNGRHFCTGFDLSRLEHETDDTLLSRFVRIELMLQRMRRAPFLTIAIAHGRTVGAGADLLAACDVRLALPGTTFAFPGARGFGLVLGTRRLAERVGPETALEWIESGRSIAAEEACARGLITAIAAVPADADGILAARALLDRSLSRALHQAPAPARVAEDAADLQQLVHSAACPGLRERIAVYAARTAARAGSSPPSSQ